MIRHRESKGVERSIVLFLIVVFGGIIAYFLNYATNVRVSLGHKGLG